MATPNSNRVVCLSRVPVMIGDKSPSNSSDPWVFRNRTYGLSANTVPAASPTPPAAAPPALVVP
jgi:hypothetical protein